MTRSIIGAVAAAGIAAVFGASAAAVSSGVSACPRWSKLVEGVPSAFRDESTKGYFVWHDSTGWHLRARVAAQPLAGRISASGRLRVGATTVADSDDVAY